MTLALERFNALSDDYIVSVLYLDCTVLILTLATFIYGVTLWCSIKKFRHFQNYVYLNLILTGVLSFTVLMIMDNSEPDDILVYSTVLFYMYVKTVYTHWLLVLCYLCYVELAKVFRVDIQRRYLKSSIFAWAAPVITVIFFVFVSVYVSRSLSPSFYNKYHYIIEPLLEITTYGSLILPLIVNFIMYIIIVFCLCRCNASSSTATGKWRRFYMATLIFVFSDMIALYSLILAQVAETDSDLIKFIFLILEHIQTMLLNVFFVVVKSNREVWREYYLNKKRQRALEITIK